MFYCLFDSLTEAAFAKLYRLRQNFHLRVIDRNGVATEIPDGPLLLKTLIDQSYTTAKTSTTVARKNLTNLKEYILTIDGANIETFHRYVKEQIEALTAAGESSSDILVNLFEAYGVVEDYNFRQWIEYKLQAWRESALDLDQEGNALMELTNYYRDAFVRQVWQTKSKEFIALA